MRSLPCLLLLGALLTAADETGGPARDGATVPRWVGRQYHALGHAGYRQRLPAMDGVRVAAFHDDLGAAFSLILDDGYVEHPATAAVLLRAAGLRATFVVNPGLMADTLAERLAAARPGKPGVASWEEWTAALADGQEVANHGMRHRGAIPAGAARGRNADTPPVAPGPPEPAAAPTDAQLIDEIVTAQQRIRERTGRACVTWVSGYNRYHPDGRALVERTHLVWRLGTGLAYGGLGRPGTAADAVATLVQRYNESFDQQVPGNGQWTLSMAHGLETGFQPMGAEVFAGHLRHLAMRRQSVWIAPAGEIARYTALAVSATLAVQRDGDGLRIRLGDDLRDPVLFDVPLTLVIEAPEVTPGTVVAAERDGRSLPATAAAGSVRVRALPGPGWIALRW